MATKSKKETTESMLKEAKTLFDRVIDLFSKAVAQATTPEPVKKKAKKR